MAVMASGMLAAAAVLLAASTAGQARSVRERRSAASDCSRAEVESSANGQQHIDYDDFCRIPNNASCRLRLNGTRIALSGADGGRNREGSSRMRAPADRSRQERAAGHQLQHYLQHLQHRQQEPEVEEEPACNFRRRWSVPYPARRKSHSDEKRGSTDDGPIHQLHSSSGA